MTCCNKPATLVYVVVAICGAETCVSLKIFDCSVCNKKSALNAEKETFSVKCDDERIVILKTKEMKP